MVQRTSVRWLRWVLSAVILFEAATCLLSSSGAPHLGLPHWVAPAVCGAEIVAVLLFLLPAATRIGGYLLLFILAVAIVLHVLHGQFEVGALIVYAMAAIVCIAPAAEALHE